MAKAPFQDPDLHTPAHDAIMMWLEENADSVVREHGQVQARYEKARAEARAARDGTKLMVRVIDGSDALLEAGEAVVDVETSWEVPTRFAGGMRYIDMLITADWVEPYAGVDKEGWIDGRATWTPHLCVSRDRKRFSIACEVKPVIRSVGELIRQLRQYEGHMTTSRHHTTSYARVAVVSPDDRFRAIIEKQGFIFIKAPQPEYGPQGGLF